MITFFALILSASSWTYADTPDEELASLTDRIKRYRAAFPDAPNYYFEMDTFAGKITATWVEVVNFGKRSGDLRDLHDDFYIAAVGFWNSAKLSLHRAERFVRAGNAAGARNCLDNYVRQVEQMRLSNNGAFHAFEGQVESARVVAQEIHEKSKFAAKVVAKMIGPAAESAVDGIYSATEFVIDATEVDIDYATRNLIARTAVEIMFENGSIEALGGRSLSESIDEGANGLVGRSGLYNVFDEVIASQETKEKMMRTFAAISSTALQSLTEDQINELVSAILNEQVDVFPVEFEPGFIRTSVSAPYHQGAISISDAIFAMRTKTGSARRAALQSLVPKLGKNLDAGDAVALSGQKDDPYFVRNIGVIQNHLPKPMGPRDVAVIVQDTNGRDRYSLLEILVPRMPAPLSVDELELVIAPSGDPYYFRAWTRFIRVGPERIRTSQAIEILAKTEGSGRRVLSQKLRYLMTDTISVKDLRALAGDPDDSAYYSCVMTFVQLLQRRISIEDSESLLSPLNGSQRRNVERELTPRLRS